MNPHPQAPMLRLVHSQAQARRFEAEPVRSWSVTIVNAKGSFSYTTVGTSMEAWNKAFDWWGASARISIKPLEAA